MFQRIQLIPSAGTHCRELLKLCGKCANVRMDHVQTCECLQSSLFMLRCRRKQAWHYLCLTRKVCQLPPPPAPAAVWLELGWSRTPPEVGQNSQVTHQSLTRHSSLNQQSLTPRHNIHHDANPPPGPPNRTRPRAGRLPGFCFQCVRPSIFCMRALRCCRA